MKYSFTLLTLIIFINPIFCLTFSSDIWHEGVVVLEDKEVIQGMLSINERYDVLQVKKNGQIHSLPAWQIRKFSIHDIELETVRNFIVLPSISKSMKFHQFYEIIIKGEIMLLSRNKVYKNLHEPSTNLANKLFPRAVNQFANNKDFFYFDGKNLIPIEQFRKVVLPAFKRQFGEEITMFIKEEKINLNYPKDQVKVVKYFNTLYTNSRELARID